jgi:hypothetical protein
LLLDDSKSIKSLLSDDSKSTDRISIGDFGMHKIRRVCVAESWKCEFPKSGWEIRENHDLQTHL